MDHVPGGRLVETPMAVQQHVDLRADRCARREGACDAVGDALFDFGFLDPVRRDAVEWRDLDRGVAVGGDGAGAVRVAFERAVADAAVDVGIDAHFFAPLFAEQGMHRHARGLRAYVHDRHLERAEHRIGRESAECVRINGQQRQRLRERFADELRHYPFQARELNCLPALQCRFAEAVQALVGGNAKKSPVLFFGYVDEQRFNFCAFSLAAGQWLEAISKTNWSRR